VPIVSWSTTATRPPTRSTGKGNPRQVTGNEWSNPPSSWPEYSFVGDTYAGFLEPGLHVGFRVADALAWVFAGTGLRGNSGCHPGGICESAMVQRITANILRLFGQGPAARHQPSVPNWRQVTSQ
jgi:hypothetical protein